MRIVLLGDSHLDRVLGDDLARLAPHEEDEVLNVAVGGSFAFDLLDQARPVVLRPEDALVVSVGTNDAAPWCAVGPYDFDREVVVFLDFLRGLGIERLVYVTPPGVDEARLTGDHVRAADDVAVCTARGVERFGAAGARIVDAWALLQPLGPDAYLDDGVHLTPAAYDVLLPAIAEAVAHLPPL